MKKSVQKEQAQRNMYVTLCVVALVALIGYGALSVADVFTVDQPKMLDSKQVEVLGRTHYRFREIYRGPSMEAHHSASSAPVVSSSRGGFSSSSSVSAAAPASGGSVSTMATVGSSAGAGALHTTSSAEAHAYGGGYSAGGTLSSMSNPANNSASSVISGGSSINMPSLAYVPRTRTTTSSAGTDAIVSGPRKIYGNGDGEYDGEYDPGTGKYWDDNSETWVDAIPVGAVKIDGGRAYRWTGSSWELIPDQEDPGAAPVGNLPICLMLILLAGYALYRKKKSACWA